MGVRAPHLLALYPLPVVQKADCWATGSIQGPRELAGNASCSTPRTTGCERFQLPLPVCGSGAGLQLHLRSTRQLPEASGTYSPAQGGNYYKRGSDDMTQVCR